MTNRLSRILGLLAVTGIAVFSQSASAQILIAPGIYAFTSRAAYEAASDSTVDATTFNNLAPKDNYVLYPTGFTSNGVDFTSPSGTNLFAIGPDYSGYNYSDSISPPSVTIDPSNLGGTAILSADLLEAASSGPLTAVGTDLATSLSTGIITADIFLAGNTTTTPDATYAYLSANGYDAGLGFLGFVTTGSTDIASIKFSDSTVDSSGYSEMVFDNFTYGIVDPDFIPEPGTYALLGLGVLALVLFRRRLAAR